MRLLLNHLPRALVLAIEFVGFRFSIPWWLAVVSAGPPLGGLYLKPPSSGGVVGGVMTMPSGRG